MKGGKLAGQPDASSTGAGKKLTRRERIELVRSQRESERGASVVSSDTTKLGGAAVEVPVPPVDNSQQVNRLTGPQRPDTRTLEVEAYERGADDTTKKLQEVGAKLQKELDAAKKNQEKLTNELEDRKKELEKLRDKLKRKGKRDDEAVAEGMETAKREISDEVAALQAKLQQKDGVIKDFEDILDRVSERNPYLKPIIDKIRTIYADAETRNRPLHEVREEVEKLLGAEGPAAPVTALQYIEDSGLGAHERAMRRGVFEQNIKKQYNDFLTDTITAFVAYLIETDERDLKKLGFDWPSVKSEAESLVKSINKNIESYVKAITEAKGSYEKLQEIDLSRGKKLKPADIERLSKEKIRRAAAFEDIFGPATVLKVKIVDDFDKLYNLMAVGQKFDFVNTESGAFTQLSDERKGEIDEIVAYIDAIDLQPDSGGGDRLLAYVVNELATRKTEQLAAAAGQIKDVVEIYDSLKVGEPVYVDFPEKDGKLTFEEHPVYAAIGLDERHTFVDETIKKGITQLDKKIEGFNNYAEKISESFSKKEAERFDGYIETLLENLKNKGSGGN